MDKLYTLLKEIQKKPHVYIGKPSLERLYAFVSGYWYSECSRQSHSQNCLDGFTQYVCDYYNLNTDHNWARIIDFFSTTDEEAFNTFYDLLEKFIQANHK